MVESWNIAKEDKTFSLCFYPLFHYSITPSFHVSIFGVPSFHSSILPFFHYSISKSS